MGRRRLLLALPLLAFAVGGLSDTTTTTPSPPLWSPAFTASYRMTAPPPRPLSLDAIDTDSIIAPQPYLVEGQWDYHPGLRRQRLKYALPLSSNDDDDAALLLAGQPRAAALTVVELWRGHDELFVYSPEARTCALIDWPHAPLPIDWPLLARLSFQGAGFDVHPANAETKSAATLLNANVWAGPPGTTVVTHFLARSTTGTGNNGTAAGAAASYAPHDVPLRLMARGRAALFTTFDLVAPTEAIFAVPPFCLNRTAVVIGAGAEGRRRAALLRVAGIDGEEEEGGQGVGVSRLHSTFFAAETMGIVGAVEEEQ